MSKDKYRAIFDIRDYISNMNLERITMDPKVMSGKPCIRGLRVTVANVLRSLAAGHSRERILEAYPYLEPEDIDACLKFAAMQADTESLEITQPA